MRRSSQLPPFGGLRPSSLYRFAERFRRQVAVATRLAQSKLPFQSVQLGIKPTLAGRSRTLERVVEHASRIFNVATTKVSLSQNRPVVRHHHQVTGVHVVLVAGFEGLEAFGCISFSDECGSSKAPSLVQHCRHGLFGRESNQALAVAPKGEPVFAQVVVDARVGESQRDREGLARFLRSFQTLPTPAVPLLGVAQNEQRPGKVEVRSGVGDIRTEQRVQD
ncbi:MAG: hypothetical protein E5V77_09665, partial [Mesorhizobium sp.]